MMLNNMEYKPGKALACLPKLKTLKEWALESKKDKIIAFCDPFNKSGYLLRNELPMLEIWTHKAMEASDRDLYFETSFDKIDKELDAKNLINEKKYKYLILYKFQVIDIYKIRDMKVDRLLQINNLHYNLNKGLNGVNCTALKEEVERVGVYKRSIRNTIERGMRRVAEQNSDFPGEFQSFTEVEFDAFGEVPNGLVTVYLAQNHKIFGYIAVYAAYIEPIFDRTTGEEYTSVEFRVL